MWSITNTFADSLKCIKLTKTITEIFLPIKPQCALLNFFTCLTPDDFTHYPGCIPCKLYAGDTPTCTILYANILEIFNFRDLNPCFEIANYGVFLICIACQHHIRVVILSIYMWTWNRARTNHLFWSDLTPLRQQFCNLTPDISGVECMECTLAPYSIHCQSINNFYFVCVGVMYSGEYMMFVMLLWVCIHTGKVTSYYTQSNITNIIFTWVHNTNTHKIIVS
jgi:hypothetical protein